MTSRRFTNATGTSYVVRIDPGRTRHTGARFEPPADMRRGTIRGFLAMCSVFAALALAAVMFS